jgi:hypothetical protein
MRRHPLFLSALLFGLLFLAHPTLAATDAVPTSASAQVTADAAAIATTAQTVNPVYDNVAIEKPLKFLSAFGLLWRGLKESLTLTFTTDPNKKAELAMKYSEERLLLAEKALESTDEAIKERAQKELERAEKFMEKVREQQEKALLNPNKETERLLKNLAANAERQHDIFDRIEGKTKGEKLDQVLEVREKMTEGSQRLENAINNENISQETKDHLIAIKARIEAHLAEVKARVEQTQTLKEAAKNGDTEAQEKLEALKQERLQEVKTSIEEKQKDAERLQKKLAELKAAAEKGNLKAAELLQKIQNMPDLQNRLDDIMEKLQNREQEQERESEQEKLNVRDQERKEEMKKPEVENEQEKENEIEIE